MDVYFSQAQGCSEVFLGPSPCFLAPLGLSCSSYASRSKRHHPALHDDGGAGRLTAMVKLAAEHLLEEKGKRRMAPCVPTGVVSHLVSSMVQDPSDASVRKLDF